MKEDDVYFDLLNLLKLVDFGVGPPPPPRRSLPG
jgi:hypothetical protein